VFRRAVFSLLQLPDPHINWLPAAVLQGLRICRGGTIAAMVTSGPPHTCHLIGLWLARLTGTPWVADFRDPWVANPYKPEFARTALSDRLDAVMQRAVIRRADRIVVINERHRAQLAEAYPREPATKFVMIPNGFDSADLAGDTPVRRLDAFTVAHVGTIYGRRSAAACLVAVARLVGAGKIPVDRIRLRFIGSVDELAKLGAIVTEGGLAAVVEFTKAVPYAEALQAMRAADLLLLLAQDQPEQIPLKAFEYLGVGAPVLAITGEGSTADLVRETGGWVCPDDPDRIGSVILECYRRYSSGRRGRELIDPPARRDVAAFERRNLARRLAATLDEVCGR
jgi:glycosyltransferase involved in cell wall biosynthesis